MNDLDNWGMRPDMADYPHPDTYDARDRGGPLVALLMMVLVIGMVMGAGLLALVLWLF